MNEQSHQDLHFLRLKQVKERCALSRSTIYARIKDGTFPSPVSLGARAVGFLSTEVDDWIARRLAARDLDANVSGAEK